MVVITCMLLCMLNSGSDLDITQTNWQGGPGEIEVVPGGDSVNILVCESQT